MGYTMKTEGLDDLSKMLNQLGEQAGKVAAVGLYDGAGVMADEIKRQAKSIKADKFHYAVFPPNVTRNPSVEEKEAVTKASAGIAKFDKNGGAVETSVGYSNSGYWNIRGKMKPVPLIANSINSGTSFMKRQPFFRKAVTKGTPKATNAIVRTAEAKIEEIINQSGG